MTRSFPPLQIFNLLYGLWWGIGLATQVRIGHNLGARRPEGAKAALRLGVFFTFVTACLSGGIIVMLSPQIASLFST